MDEIKETKEDSIDPEEVILIACRRETRKRLKARAVDEDITMMELLEKLSKLK